MIIQLKLNYLSFKKYDRPVLSLFTLSINVNKHFQVDSGKDTSKLTAEKVPSVLGLDVQVFCIRRVYISKVFFI